MISPPSFVDTSDRLEVRTLHPRKPAAPLLEPKESDLPAPLPQSPPSLALSNDAVTVAITANLKAVAMVLSARALLMLALIGGFVLAVLASSAATLVPLYVLIAYALLILIPLVVLERGNRR